MIPMKHEITPRIETNINNSVLFFTFSNSLCGISIRSQSLIWCDIKSLIKIWIGLIFKVFALVNYLFS